MEVNKIICGDTLETVKTFPDESIDSVITSPPYYQLRDYGWNGQWGLEKTYQEYLDKMIELMKELKRVLKPTGTMWINLGDTYSTISGGTRGLLRNERQFGAISHKAVLGQGFNQIKPKEYPKKSLMLIPHRFAIRCIDELGLILRNDIIWGKRNGLPESVTDRFSKKHEFIFFFVKEPKYYFDLDSIRDKPITKEKRSKRIVYNSSKNDETNKTNTFIPPNPKGKNPGDVADFWNKNIKGNMTKDGLTRTTAGLNLKSAEEKINPLGKNPGDVSDFWDKSKSYPNRKYFFRENYFETIDTEDKAYWLGFIWADGYLNKHSLEIEIHIKDKDHLIEFQEDLCDNHKIYEKERGTTHSCKLTLGSQKLVNDLISLGYKDKKIPNNLPEQLERHFIRGLFDGDGSVGFYKGRGMQVRHWLEFLGKYELMEWVAKRLKSIGMFDQVPKENKGTFRLSYVDGDASIFYDYVYSHYSRCLERKKCRFPQELNYEYDFFDVPTKPNKEKHYATYNSQLIDKPIIAGCPEGGIILDPFCGIGTTLVRAIELNRNAIGIDGKKEYCEIAQAKLNEVLRQQKLFSNIKEEQCSD